MKESARTTVVGNCIICGVQFIRSGAGRTAKKTCSPHCWLVHRRGIVKRAVARYRSTKEIRSTKEMAPIKAYYRRRSARLRLRRSARPSNQKCVVCGRKSIQINLRRKTCSLGCRLALQRHYSFLRQRKKNGRRMPRRRCRLCYRIVRSNAIHVACPKCRPAWITLMSSKRYYARKLDNNLLAVAAELQALKQHLTKGTKNENGNAQ